MQSKLTASAALAFLVSAGALAAPIADVAPANSFLVAGVDDWPEMRAAFDRTGLHDLWQEDSVREFLVAYGESMVAGPWAWLRDAGVEVKDLPEPAGAVGFALFLAPGDEDDADGGATRLQGLLMVDYADDAARADAMMEIIDDVVARAERDGVATSEVIDVRDIEATRVEVDYEAIDEMAAEDAAGDEDDLMWLQDDEPLALRDLMDTAVIGRVGNAVLIATSAEALGDAIDHVQGVPGAGPTIGDDETYLAAMRQHPDGWHAHGVLLTGPVLASLQDPTTSPLGDLLLSATPGLFDTLTWLGPVGTAIGLSEVKALSTTTRLDAGQANAESTVAALAPVKRGLVSLLDGPAEPFTPPAFVGAEAASLSSMRINFRDLLPTLRAAFAALPPDMAAGWTGQLDMIEMQFGQMVGAMGSRLEVATVIERPFTLESRRQVWAVALRDEQAMRDGLGALAPLMGAAGRDFLGTIIWESQFAPFAAAVTGGRLLISAPEEIERALREASDPARAKLADDPGFVAATKDLAPGVGHVYEKFGPATEYAAWLAENADRLWRTELENMGAPPEEIDDMIAMMRASMPAWLDAMPSVDVMRRHLGDTVAEIRSTPEGYVVRTLNLRPRR